MTTDDSAAQVRDELKELMDSFFHAVSFPAGSRPRYESLHDLFVAGGKLIKASSDPAEVSTIDEFIQPRLALVDSGQLTSFEEIEISEMTESFGRIAHRLSTYSKRGTQSGSTFVAKGVISTQFLRTTAGWKITSMAWDDERPGLSLPEQ